MRWAPVPCSIHPHHVTKIIRTITCKLVYSTDQSAALFSRSSLSAHGLPHGCTRKVSTNTHNVSVIRHTDGFAYGKSGLPIDLELFLSPKRQKSNTEWAGAIDAYLPASLRSETVDVPSTDDNQSIDTLPQVLARARSQGNLDLLSYLGIYQGRWEAVIWLVNAMMEHFSGSQAMEKRFKEHLSLVWLGGEKTLDSLTQESIYLNPPPTSPISPVFSFDHEEENNVEPLISIGWQALGQIWQSLGTMILQAADRSPEDPAYSLVMTHVFRILAVLHRMNAIPDTTYNYEPAADQNVLHRPPTLYLLSKRIMSTLSDTEFDHHWQGEITKYQGLGYDLAQNPVRPRIREFGPELWLDLVLWVCVEGGWVMEGAWIIVEIEKRKASRDTQWSAISWQEICATQAPELDWVSILKYKIDKTRLNQVGSIGMATGSDFTVVMGTRTLSQEVILALMDGLLNVSLFTLHEPQKGTGSILRGLVGCKNLLERDHTHTNSQSLNSAILRLMENAGYAARNTFSIVNQLVDTRLARDRDLVENVGILPKYDKYTDRIAPVLGLLHKTLYDFAKQGNLQGSLSIFRKLQDVVDKERDRTIRNFVTNVKSLEPELGADELLLDNEPSDNLCALTPQIPTDIVATFIDNMIDSSFYDVGYWLLLNQDVDGGPLSPEIYSDCNLQPALLRFATATADNNILTKVLENLESPLPEAVLHALLPCQIVLGKWSGVEQLLDFFRKTPGMRWKASDAMALGRAVLNLEYDASDHRAAEQIPQAVDILRNLIHGRYNTDRDLSELPNLTQMRLANQIGRVLQSLPGSLSNVKPEPCGRSLRAQASIQIPSDAFKIILDTVVECHGPFKGMELWNLWCHEPKSFSPESLPQSNQIDVANEALKHDIANAVERVVQPTQSMLRSILRPILDRQDLSSKHMTHHDTEQNYTENTYQEVDKSVPEKKHRISVPPLLAEEQEVLRWGIAMYRRFGVSQKELGREIPRELLNL